LSDDFWNLNKLRPVDFDGQSKFVNDFTWIFLNDNDANLGNSNTNSQDCDKERNSFLKNSGKWSTKSRGCSDCCNVNRELLGHDLSELWPVASDPVNGEVFQQGEHYGKGTGTFWSFLASKGLAHPTLKSDLDPKNQNTKVVDGVYRSVVNAGSRVLGDWWALDKKSKKDGHETHKSYQEAPFGSVVTVDKKI
jgi:hypothetical protein